ncbi:hypothetical protein BOTNAR_0114g00140 [Botryotinia narcissicola]|uniref:Uncharacterized protein n=1 Tax=Botryotinia narcissicola TaxID=278944 RepID=A0A4Z1IM33_9HELO|nr:hypothetical protein BOTNAR_0114g00140 [Botryotinia narcissicola]
MPERKGLDDYFMYRYPPDYQLGPFLRTPSPISSSSRIVPKNPDEIDESPKKTVAQIFKATVWAKLEQSKKSESQGPDADQSNKVAASKLSDLKGKAPEERKMKDLLEENMARERKIAELQRENEELANQLRILNERLEERLEERVKGILEEVDRREQIVLEDGQRWAQKNLTVYIREKAVRDKDALQEAKSTTLLQREDKVHEREENVLRREEQVLEQEEKMAQLQKQLNGKASKLVKTERLVERFFKEIKLTMPKEEDLEPEL